MNGRVSAEAHTSGQRERLAIFTVGPAASGKSSWAKSVASRYAGLRIAIIERDAIRVALHVAEAGMPFSWSSWNHALEGQVQWLWEQAVRKALQEHDAIILADTHLDLTHLNKEVAWLRCMGVVDMAIQYFPALPLVELIRRDQSRPHAVGAAVLREHIQKLQAEERYWAALAGAAAATTEDPLADCAGGNAITPSEAGTPPGEQPAEALPKKR